MYGRTAGDEVLLPSIFHPSSSREVMLVKVAIFYISLQLRSLEDYTKGKYLILEWWHRYAFGQKAVLFKMCGLWFLAEGGLKFIPTA